MRKINVWRKYLKPQLFEDIYLEPAVGKTDASLWRKHRETGIITNFSRGKKLDDYRLMLIKKDEFQKVLNIKEDDLDQEHDAALQKLIELKQDKYFEATLPYYPYLNNFLLLFHQLR